jgi:tetratricopeptide (TPR) repeat protein
MSLIQRIRPVALLAAAALLAGGLALKPVTLYAAGTDNPPPADDGKKKKKGSAIEEQEKKLAQEKFLRGYRAARELILAGQYQAGIAAMHALGHDAHPDVANYIGYANRKLGNYDQSKIWYEAALKADPNHVRTWSYYGMWHMEQGNRLKAEDHLTKVKAICGTVTCEEYTQLKAVYARTARYSPCCLWGGRARPAPRCDRDRHARRTGRRYGRASRMRLNGVCMAVRKCRKPAFSKTWPSCAPPACAPSTCVPFSEMACAQHSVVEAA